MIFTLLVLLGLGRYKIKVPHDMSQPKKVGENKGTTFSLKKEKKGKGGGGGVVGGCFDVTIFY